MKTHIPEQHRHLFEELNDMQRVIASSTEGRYAVLASAGSGKTKTLTTRTAYLLEQGIPGWQIMCVTFTNKAAKEMRQRIENLVGEKAEDLWMGTFHSLCLRIIQRHRSKLGYESMTIIDDEERKTMLMEIIPFVSVTAEYSLALKKIEEWQNNMVKPETLMAGTESHNPYIHIYAEYQDRKKLAGYIDFNDILNLTIDLLTLDDTVRNAYQTQFRYVMCDEAQDVNNAQYELLNLFSGQYENLALIGDDYQSIYGFRGANVYNMIAYSNRPDVTLLKLEQNYRSHGLIIEASNGLIRQNGSQMEKRAFTENPHGEPIFVYRASDANLEADFIVKSIIKKEVDEGKKQYKDFAILYRNNSQSNLLEVALNQYRVPFQVYGNMSFFDRKEIKDLLSYLRAVDNDLDYIAFERIINVPKRGIGAKAIERIHDYATKVGIPFQKALYHVADIPGMTGKAVSAVTEFITLIDMIREKVREEEDCPIRLAISLVLTHTRFSSQFANKNEEERSKRMKNIEDFLEMATKWEEDDKLEETSDIHPLTRFLLQNSIASEEEDSENKVTLMSAHSSKGLEFDTVFIIGMEEGRFPSSYAKTVEDFEEERRLMYVAMTRAERRLFLTFSEKGSGYRKIGDPSPKPSRFFSDIPRELMHVHGKD